MEDLSSIYEATHRWGGSDSSGGGSTDYISQLVQFTTLESLNELSETLTTSVILQQQQQAFSLINKQVTLMDGTETLSGTIEKVRFCQWLRHDRRKWQRIQYECDPRDWWRSKMSLTIQQGLQKVAGEPYPKSPQSRGQTSLFFNT